MPNVDRTKLLVHVRRISTLLEGAIIRGPDGTLEGKFGEEHPTFIHYALSYYLMGCLGYLAGEGGEYSWNEPSASHNGDFDNFIDSNPTVERSYRSLGITKERLEAFACVRNALAHNNCDLAANRDQDSLVKVQNAELPGIVLNGSVVTLEAEALELIRISTIAVREFHGDS